MIRRSGGDTPRSTTTTSSANFTGASRGKKIWTTEEDETLKNLVSSFGTGNWTLVAQSLPERTGKQCRERWHNHLGSGIKKGDWTEEEDRIIITMQRHIGNQWAKITKMLPGRTDNAVKNRFHATERAKSRGKCDDSLYNSSLDDAFFESLKKQHTDIDFDGLCEQHANSLLQGGADGSSVDNGRTSSITGSDASSVRIGKAQPGSAALNSLGAGSYVDDEDDDALSEEDEEEGADGEGEMQDNYQGANLADVGQLEDSGDIDAMHLMDIDIISFDSDDMNLDFDEGIHHSTDTRNPAGDNCCFSYFDWGCSTYYKNVFNPADKRNNVGLPSSSQAGNQRPGVLKQSSISSQGSRQSNSNNNFYNLPPAPTGAIELQPMPQQQPQQMAAIGMPQQVGIGQGYTPTALQLAAQAAQAGSPPMPQSQMMQLQAQQQAQQQQQQAQMLYASMPAAPMGAVVPGQPGMVPSVPPRDPAHYQQYLQQQQQLQLQQQQYMAAYQQSLGTPQQQQQFQQFQVHSQLQQAQMHSQMQQAQLQAQFMQQQQQQQQMLQQQQMMQQGAFPQQYAMQYTMQQQQQAPMGANSNNTRPVSSSSYGSANSRPVSSSSYGSAALH